MSKAENIYKKAFFTPFDVNSKKEYYSGKGYAKEYGNRTVSAFAGMFGGAAAGGVVGAATAGVVSSVASVLAKKPINRPIESVVRIGTLDANLLGGAGLGAMLGGVVGAGVGDYRAIKKTEAEAGVNVTKNVGNYLGRAVGSSITSAAIPLPFTGAIGDYYVSRHMLDNKMQKTGASAESCTECGAKHEKSEKHSKEMKKCAKCKSKMTKKAEFLFEKLAGMPNAHVMEMFAKDIDRAKGMVDGPEKLELLNSIKARKKAFGNGEYKSSTALTVIDKSKQAIPETPIAQAKKPENMFSKFVKEHPFRAAGLAGAGGVATGYAVS